MTIAVDASSPAVFTSTTATATSASFTPPVGSLLVCAVAANSTNGVNPTTPTITDNRGTPLTYTLRAFRSRADGSPVIDGQAALWTAPVTSSVAMTVSITTAGAAHKGCRIWVLTGQNTTNPIGALGKAGSSSSSAIVQNYTATGNNSLGFIVALDWDALGSFTAGTGCTLQGTGNVGSGQISYGFAKRTNPDGVNGVTNTLRISPAGTSTNLNWVYQEILEQPASGQTVAVGQVTETSTAQAVTRRKTKAVGQVTETSTSQAITRLKRKALGQISETSTAQSMVWKLNRLINQVSETSTSQLITPRKSTTLSQATETSTAQALARLKTKAIGQVTETSTAQAVTTRKILAVSQVNESSTAQTLTHRKTLVVSQISESSAAQTVGRNKSRVIGQITETSAADSVTNPAAPTEIGQITETSTAQSISVRKTRVVSQIVETSAANTVARVKTQLISQINESGTAQVIVRFNVPLIVQVNETNLAIGISGGTATGDTHGWRPLLGLHCIYLEQKTFGGSSQYIKRRPVKIIGFASDGYPILLQKQSGVQYGTASVGIRPRSHPDADEFDVYVSY